MVTTAARRRFAVFLGSILLVSTESHTFAAAAGLDNGTRCTDRAQCRSGFCTDTTCCSTDGCPEVERCDVFGFQGDCNQQLAAGEPCEKHSDCIAPLLCQPVGPGGAVICFPAPTPTPFDFFPTWTPTVTVGPLCVGDCSRDRAVAIDELVTMVDIALGTTSFASCEAGDANGDRRITVDEIVTAAGNALTGCPG